LSSVSKEHAASIFRVEVRRIRNLIGYRVKRRIRPGRLEIGAMEGGETEKNPAHFRATRQEGWVNRKRKRNQRPF
jgi:hypothetical protein